MAVTLVDAAIQAGPSPIEAAVVKQFVQVSPILDRLPMMKIDGNAYTYNIEDTLPSVMWRAVNQAWSESSGTLRPATERLMILGGEVKVDRFIQETTANRAKSVKASQYAMKVQAASNEFDRAFFEGDSLVDTNELVGLRQRIATGNQLILAGSGGATLTLAMLDTLIDAIPFRPIDLYMSKTMRRKVTSLVNAAGGTLRITESRDGFGKQQTHYNEARINIVERVGDASTTLGFDEDPGDGTSDCTSIYAVAYGMERVHGIWNGSKPVSVEEFGVLESEPRYMGRIEGYVGLVIHHPRAVGRLYGILNA